MDLGREPVLILRGCAPFLPWEDTPPGMIHATGDPRTLRPSGIPATEYSRKAAANAPETRREFEKDVNFQRNKPKKFFRIKKSLKKTSSKAVKTKRKNVRQKGKIAQTKRRSEPRKASTRDPRKALLGATTGMDYVRGSLRGTKSPRIFCRANHRAADYTKDNQGASWRGQEKPLRRRGRSPALPLHPTQNRRAR
jgi:hypothetical protein